MGGDHTCYTCGRLAGTEHTETCPRRAWGALVTEPQCSWLWEPTHEEEAERVGRNARELMGAGDAGDAEERGPLLQAVIDELMGRHHDGSHATVPITTNRAIAEQAAERVLRVLAEHGALLPMVPTHVAMLSSCPGCGKPIGGMYAVMAGWAYVCDRCACTWLCTGVEGGEASWCRREAPAHVVEAARQLDERAGGGDTLPADRGAADGGLRPEL